eukprot:316856-Chlamydomonas_euryale.AAC.1
MPWGAAAGAARRRVQLPGEASGRVIAATATPVAAPAHTEHCADDDGAASGRPPPPPSHLQPPAPPPLLPAPRDGLPSPAAAPPPLHSLVWSGCVLARSGSLRVVLLIGALLLLLSSAVLTAGVSRLLGGY